MTASQVACEAIWMRKIMVGLFGQQMDPTMIMRVVSNSLIIKFFMIGPSILISDIIISEIVY